MNRKQMNKQTSALGKAMLDSIEVINRLSAVELIALNEMIISRLKEIRREECAQKAQQFKIGDFVSFEDDAKRREGIVLKIHQKTVKVFTTEELAWKVSPTLLRKIGTPSSALEKLAHDMFPKMFS